jgi:uncharacterized delta-60 repeat protein
MLLNYLPDFIAGEKAYFSSAISIALLILLFSFSVFAAAPGDLDLTFGLNGTVELNVAMTPRASDTILVQADGKLIIAGYARTGVCPQCTDFAVARLLPNGQLDPSFGTNGVVLTDMRTSGGGAGQDEIKDAVLQPDGKIVVVGRAAYEYGAPFAGSAYALARYNPDGTLDTTFDGDGKLVMPSLGWHNSIGAVVVKADGEIVFAGTRGRCPDCSNRTRIDMVRLSPSGSFIGVSQVTQTGDVIAREMVIQTDGKILVGGYAVNLPDTGYIFARLNPEGSFDTSFGTNGIAFMPGTVFEGGVVDLALHSDGKISAVGMTRTGSLDTYDFEILRLNPNGSLDAGFGAGGRVTFVNSGYDNVGGVVAQPADGKVLVGGSASGFGAVIIRYNPDGSLDPSFGRGGIATNPAAPAAAPIDLALQADGKIVTTGGGITIARFLNSGQHRDYDFDGDGRDDISIFRPNAAAAEWYWLNSSTNQSSGIQFGVGADQTVPADYDGDGKTDVSVFRNGDWYRLNSSNGLFVAAHFGQAGDVPVPADYDGDTKVDLAVYRQGNWYILNSSNDSFRADQFGIASDKPIVGADFDGDGRADLAVYRDGTWYGIRSRDGFFGAQFGIASDKPVAGDYDGDGKTDLAVYRPSDGVWYLSRSNLGFTATQFGISTDKPVPADYDGDGKTDLAVYRDGDWYLLQSTAGFAAKQFGTINDRPVPNSFVP